MKMDPERKRIAQAADRTQHWARWGPYLSERQWGTVREDYSADGDAWNYVTHEMARSYAYRWGEEGIAGISDNHQRLCLGIALWNGRDRILKERLFGLTNPQGNHGEDVKECYWYLDATPTHSYLQYLYRYPQEAFPYEALIEENGRRDRRSPEYELLDTGVFDGGRFFDVLVEYAKASPEDVLLRITVTNCGPEAAPLSLMPALWFRNDWSWRMDAVRPRIFREEKGGLRAEHPTLGQHFLAFQSGADVLFTENETNNQRLFDSENASRYVKDAFDRYLVGGEQEAVSRESGTKSGLLYQWSLPAGAKQQVRLRLSAGIAQQLDEKEFNGVFALRRLEADEFFKALAGRGVSSERAMIQRQAMAGLIWSKQWYYYVVQDWLQGDPATPPPPPERLEGRNSDWVHLYNDDVLLMPDSWEYPWYAVWDSAFHSIAIARLDPHFAKRQLDRFTREWYMHPNGQLPAYEWSLDDVNPPVHAWATWRVYKIEQKHWGQEDRLFLERVFHKLLMNFTWWVNRKDRSGRNLFEGGFLGMDNIGVFDRSAPLPQGVHLLQSDSTSWMAMYCLNMLRIAWELSRFNPAYEDIASKFYEHFLYIANAMSRPETGRPPLWDEKDGFFYDQLDLPGGETVPLRIRSLVGLVPLFAVEILGCARLDQLHGFRRRMEWFDRNRSDLTSHISRFEGTHEDRRCYIFSVMQKEQLERVLRVMLDENEFLSDFGIRSLSRYHRQHPFELDLNGRPHTVRYEPDESSQSLFGGNSNWRGPLWFPMNFLIIEALHKYHYFWGEDFKVEFPTGSANWKTLGEVADLLSERLISLFEKKDGRRPIYGDSKVLQHDPAWQDRLWFYEYFDGDSGAGLGASHQTGWTSLVAKLIFHAHDSDPVGAEADLD